MANSSNLPSNPFNDSKIVIVKIEHWWDSYIVQTALCFGQANDYIAQRISVDGGSYSNWKKTVLS